MLKYIINNLSSLFYYIYYKIKILYCTKTIQDILNNSKKNLNSKKKTIGLLLCAGKSTRFGQSIPKQLYILNNKTIISYSIDLLSKFCNQIIIITNTICYDEIHKIIEKFYHNDTEKIFLITNNINCRLESIETGLSFIKRNFKINPQDNIVIHESARPFVSDTYFSNILKENKPYSQYCLKLTNGLMDKENLIVIDRDNYIELCTPILSNFMLYEYIFMNFISKKNRFAYEPINILREYKININILYGHHKYLKKITHIEDIQ